MKKEDITFLNELQQELNTQSNCGNASPVFWVIRQYEKQITDSDFGEETLYIHSDGDYLEFEKLDELLEFLSEGSEFDAVKDCETLDDAFDILLNDFNEDNYFARYSATKAAVVKQDTFFITHKEALEHIKKNRRHYNSTVHTYAMTAWRSPVVEKLWEILREADFNKLLEVAE
ncbi:hypothetical protein AJN32_04755 [Listeria monocytogenes]|uniref:hypothetical protein n=2 Tax=Listeria monocytogenes TaxID=1639 RepID=UPI00086B88C8|nr:hypothetical protein [Listeria monocytogenes]OEQ79746.1 hypothetical protein AJN32_04755 [Listeria monocytogenes]RKC80517.1 hypothetical protein AF944_02941 [Listeria monocytogenes]